MYSTCCLQLARGSCAAAWRWPLTSMHADVQVLLSATLPAQLGRLASLSMQDPVAVGFR